MADDVVEALKLLYGTEMQRHRLASKLGSYSRLRWADWASKRKVAQPHLAQACELLRKLMNENASLRRDRDGLVQLVRDLQPLIGLHDVEMADRLDRFDAYVSCGYDLGAACHLLDSKRRPQ